MLCNDYEEAYHHDESKKTIGTLRPEFMTGPPFNKESDMEVENDPPIYLKIF